MANHTWLKITGAVAAAVVVISIITISVIEIEYKKKRSEQSDDYKFGDGIRYYQRGGCPKDYDIVDDVCTKVIEHQVLKCPSGETYEDGQCYKDIEHPKNICPTGYDEHDQQCIRPSHDIPVVFPQVSPAYGCPIPTTPYSNYCYDRLSGRTSHPSSVRTFDTSDKMDMEVWKRAQNFNFSTTIDLTVYGWRYPPCETYEHQMGTAPNIKCYPKSARSAHCPSSHPDMVGNVCYNREYSCPSGYGKRQTLPTTVMGQCHRWQDQKSFDPCPNNSSLVDGKCIVRINRPHKRCPDRAELKDDKCVEQLLYRG